MELTGSDENQVKAGPDKDKEKKQTRWASSTNASTNCVRYRLICSIVLVLSWPVNLANSRSLVFVGRATKSYHSGYGCLYKKVSPFGFRPNWFFIISVTLNNNSSAYGFGFLYTCWRICGLNPVCLDILDLVSCEGCYNLCHYDSPMESLSVPLFSNNL